MGRVKSDNWHLGVLSGYEVRWRHSGAAETVTITPRAGEPIVLLGIDVNKTNNQDTVVRDSAVGVIATLVANIVPGAYLRPLKLKGNLIIENPGAMDLTIRFRND